MAVAGARGGVTPLDVVVMILCVILPAPTIFTGARIDRWEDAVLLLAYAAFMTRLVP